MIHILQESTTFQRSYMKISVTNGIPNIFLPQVEKNLQLNIQIYKSVHMGFSWILIKTQETSALTFICVRQNMVRFNTSVICSFHLILVLFGGLYLSIIRRIWLFSAFLGYCNRGQLVWPLLLLQNYTFPTYFRNKWS